MKGIDNDSDYHNDDHDAITSHPHSLVGCLPLNILKGHSGKVTCLLYPNEENPRYDITHLVSGGSDFTVRLWDVFSGTLLHTFNSHGGEVVKLMVTPPDCSVKSYFLSLLSIRRKKSFRQKSCFVRKHDSA